MTSKHLSLFIILLYSLTTITRVLATGFHPDSLVYMSMARNLAETPFTFWNLQFTYTIFEQFYEHPPLGIYIMSTFFLLFGDTLLIDKYFGIVFGLLIMMEIIFIYRLISIKNTKNGIYLALFYFIMFPMTSYTLENNLLEIPATFFTLGTVYIFLRGVLNQKNQFLYSFLFSTILLASFLVKGPVTLFPLALPFFYYLIFSKKYSLIDMLKFYTATLVFSSLYILILWFYEPSNHYLSMYLNNQVLGSINGSRGGDDNFKLTFQLILDFSALFLVSLLLIYTNFSQKSRLIFSKMFWLFILIGLSASLPLEISPRQHNYYIFPSLAYFSIALSLLFVNNITNLIKKWGGYKFIIILNIALTIAFIAVAWQQSKNYRRHENFHHDFIEANIKIKRNSNIKVCSNNKKDDYQFFINTEFTGNMQRYYKANLFDTNTTMPYYITTINSIQNCTVDENKYKYIGLEKPNYYLIYQYK